MFIYIPDHFNLNNPALFYCYNLELHYNMDLNQTLNHVQCKDVRTFAKFGVWSYTGGGI